MNELQKIESFRADLAIAETIEEVKLHESAASAMAQFAKANKISTEKQNELGRFRIEIEQKKGSVLDELFPSNQGKQIIELHKETLKTEGITKRESSRARDIAKEQDIELIMDSIEEEGHVITPNKVDQIIKKIKRKQKVEQQKQDIKSQPTPEINGSFDVLVLDPPWNYGREYDPDTSRVANPYPEMNQQQLKELKIQANDNAVMWLWTTHAFMQDAFELLKHWGFDYKAILTWDKQNMGMGYWLRMQTEFCLLAVKGKPIWDNTKHRDIIHEKRREHSRKPEAFYDMVNDICYGTKLEYFARESRNGFEVFGNDTEKF